MAEKTNISWADDTFNPWEGCQKVSPACDGCYAEARNLRYAPKGTEAAPNWGPGAPRRRTSASNWAKPLKWEKEQARAWAEFKMCFEGEAPGMIPPPPRFVFCASLADVFDNQVPVEWRRDLFRLITATPHLTWLLLTKRPGNILPWVREQLGDGATREAMSWCWPRNAAIGCTVVTQEEADRDIPKLLAAKAAVNPAFAFVSMEPLLGPVDLMRWFPGCNECISECGWRSWRSPPEEQCTSCGGIWAGLGEFCPACGGAEFVGVCPDCCSTTVQHHPDTPVLDWVITGGETDQGAHKARPSHPDWFRSLRDQCAAAGVAYHHKQNGEWAPDPELDRPFVSHGSHAQLGTISPLLSSRGQYAVAWTRRSEPKGSLTEGIQLKRLGKKAAGRFLDGVIHDARPEVGL